VSISRKSVSNLSNVGAHGVIADQQRQGEDGMLRDVQGCLEHPCADARPLVTSAMPLMGLPRRDRFYATRLRQLAHLEIDEMHAAALYRNVAVHRREMSDRLGRDVGQRVALLDYIVNVEPQLAEPQIIGRTALEAMAHRADLADKDAVTGLQNRHAFDEALQRETERSMRYCRAASLLLLDLDDFKKVNDRCGHRVGDQALQAVGSLILRHVRAADVPCRYGGDEFAVILPDTPRPVALGVATRICQDVNEFFRRQPIAGFFLSTRVSGGVASLPLPEGADGSLFELADRALYHAKQNGGDQVTYLTSQETVS
jgi:diguanylate cyclase (GGDEF)-like protein